MFLKFNQKTSYFHKQEVVTKLFMNNKNFIHEKVLREPLSSRTGEYPVKMIMINTHLLFTSYMNKSLSRQVDSNRRPMAHKTGKLSCSTLIMQL